MFKVTVTLTFELLTQNYLGPWPFMIHYTFMIQRKVNLDEISLTLMSAQDFANTGHTDGHVP